MTSRVSLPDAAATRALGERLGRAATPGTTFALSGTLGAGKTTLAQGFAAGFGVPDGHRVTSPTFAIWQTYSGTSTLHHLDLYRLEGAEEADAAGLDEAFGPDAVSLVEWSERCPALLPEDHVHVRLAYDERGGRLATLEALGPSATAWLARLRL